MEKICLKYNSTLIMLMLYILALTGCALLPPQAKEMSSISQADLLSGEILFDPTVTNLNLPEAEVLKVTDSMRDYLYQHIPKSANSQMKLRLLIELMFKEEFLGITYDGSQTLTAEGAFLSGRGNCLAVSYLFTSLANELGLRTYFRNVDIPPEWKMESDVIYRYRHVNVEVKLNNTHLIIVDADEVKNIPTYEANRISTENAVAQFYSNKGAYYLAINDTLQAFLYLKKAIITDPSQAEFWTNLGVLYSRAGKYDYAESAYKTALNLHSQNTTAISNMSSLYEKMGKPTLAAEYKTLVDRLNNKNPYLRFIRASRYFENEDYSNSLSNVLWAIRKEDNEPKFFTLLANIYEKTNQPDKALEARLMAKAIEDKIQKLIDEQAVRITYREKQLAS